MGEAVATETARMITVSQILDGEDKCYCGDDAVLVVDTEPDNDPGAVCYRHGMERITFMTSVIANIFGHKA